MHNRDDNHSMFNDIDMLFEQLFSYKYNLSQDFDEKID